LEWLDPVSITNTLFFFPS
jgi:acyl-CoA-dependent ceramide synthase